MCNRLRSLKRRIRSLRHPCCCTRPTCSKFRCEFRPRKDRSETRRFETAILNIININLLYSKH